MDNDFLDHQDLLRLAKCKHKAKLRKWLVENEIPFKLDSGGGYIASKRLVESRLGYDALPEQEPEVELWLGDQSAA